MCDNRILRSARLIDCGGGRLRPAGGLPVPHRRDGEERVGARSPGSRLVHRQRRGGDRGGRAGSVGGHRVRCVSASRPVCAHERSGGRRRRGRAPGFVGARRGVRPVSTWLSAIRRMCRTILTSPFAPIPSDHRVGARMGCRLRRPPRPGPAVRGGARPARSRRHLSGRAIGVRRSASNTWRRWPTPDWTRKSLPTSGFRSDPYWRRGPAWLEDTGRLEPGRREEELVVIRAEKP